MLDFHPFFNRSTVEEFPKPCLNLQFHYLTTSFTETMISGISFTHTHTPLQTRLIVEGGLKPIDGEGDDAGKDGCPTVDEGNSDGLALKVVVVLIVAGKRYK